jgi:hypothetical protein
MARGRSKKSANKSAYFRNVFGEKPQWLNQKSNNELLARYRADHNLPNDADVGSSVKQAMANVKSLLRKSGKGGTATKLRKAPTTGGFHLPIALGKVTLETLEELIDECLVSAKHLDRQGLDKVIGSLRKARNEVVWKLGEKD